MNSVIMLALARSIAIMTAIAAVVGGSVWYIAETGSLSKGLIAFIAALILQYAMSSIVSSISARKNEEAEFLAQQVLKEASERKMPYTLNCAYCNTQNRSGISFTHENIFDCTSCNQPNKVYVQFSTVRLTTPLTQKENPGQFIDMDEEDTKDSGARQTTVNDPLKVT